MFTFSNVVIIFYRICTWSTEYLFSNADTGCIIILQPYFLFRRKYFLLVIRVWASFHQELWQISEVLKNKQPSVKPVFNVVNWRKTQKNNVKNNFYHNVANFPLNVEKASLEHSICCFCLSILHFASLSLKYLFHITFLFFCLLFSYSTFSSAEVMLLY